MDKLSPFAEFEPVSRARFSPGRMARAAEECRLVRRYLMRFWENMVIQACLILMNLLHLKSLLS